MRFEYLHSALLKL